MTTNTTTRVTWLVVTEVRSAGLGLMLHAQHIFANYFNFLVTRGLPVTVFHSMCIFCVYGMARTVLANTAVPCVYTSFVCRHVAPPGECYHNTLLCCDNFSSSNVVSRAFSALCVYSKFGHHPHPLGYLCAKFRFFGDRHCWARPWRKIACSITQSTTHPAYLMSRNRSLSFRIY